MSLLVELYPYTSLKRTTKQSKRLYSTPSGDVPSVTTILDATKSKESRRALSAWRKRIGIQEAQKITSEAANMGTVVHSMLENHINGKETTTKSNIIYKRAEKLADIVIEQGFKNLNEVWGTEVSLFYPDLYAGTTDCVGLWKNKQTIIDFKTTKKPKKREWVDDYFLQGVAYALAHNSLYDTHIENIVIMMITWDGENAGLYQEYVIDENEFENYAEKWGEKVSEYYDLNK